MTCRTKSKPRCNPRFRLEARDFGQPVNLSEVITTIQNVNGVEGVEVTALYFSTDTATPSPLKTYLAANIPQTGARVASLAELLTLDSAPLALTMETASS